MSSLKKPFFSVIVCTRNRPDILKYCLWALKGQIFKDFEVILSDNSDPEIQAINKHFVEKLRFKNLKYVRPPRVLNMVENYNFALNQSKGEYVGVLTDKHFFRKNALKELYAFLQEEPVEILNFNQSMCSKLKRRLLKWRVCRSSCRNDFEFYSPQEALLKRFELDIRREQQGIHYFVGKIFFGFYHHSLISRIKQQYGEIFYEASPDYTSLVFALHLAKKAVFYHKEVVLGMLYKKSNGYNVIHTPGAPKKLLASVVKDVDKVLKNLPIPYVYTAHNFCAYDYTIINRLGGCNYQLNLQNLAQRVYEDLSIFPFESEEEKKGLYGHFYRFVEEKNITLQDITAESLIIPAATAPAPPFFKRLFAFLFVKKNKWALLKNFLSTKVLNHHFTFNSLLR